MTRYSYHSYCFYASIPFAQTIKLYNTRFYTHINWTKENNRVLGQNFSLFAILLRCLVVFPRISRCLTRNNVNTMKPPQCQVVSSLSLLHISLLRQLTDDDSLKTPVRRFSLRICTLCN